MLCGLLSGLVANDVGHRAPPTLANLGLRDRIPERLVLDFGVGEQLVRLAQQKYRVAARAVRVSKSLPVPGQIGLWRRSYSASCPGFSVITKALRIMVCFSDLGLSFV